jgi:hypothetical protein
VDAMQRQLGASAQPAYMQPFSSTVIKIAPWRCSHIRELKEAM